MLIEYWDIVAVKRPFSETVVTGTIKFCDTKWRRSVESFVLNDAGATLSPRHARCNVHRNEQSFDDFVKWRPGT
jgi:hypothetical protein